MASNLTTQAAQLATVPANSTIGTREGTYGGSTVHVAPVILATHAAGTTTDVSNSNPVPVSDAGGSLTIDAASLPLPTGAASLAEQQTQTIHLNNIATATAVMDDWDEADRAKVNLIVGQAGVAGGSGVVGATTQRVVLATDVALPTGSNTIGNVGVAGGSVGLLAGVANIGNVGVTSVVPGTAATNLGKAEDAVHASGDTGVMALAVRSDALSAASGTSGDYEPLHTDSVGALWVRESGAVPDDSAFVVALSRVQPIGFLADETSTDSVDEGDAGAARMTLDRRQIVVSQPHAAGGCSIFRSLDLDETEEEVKATGGTLYGYFIANLATSTRFVKFYNATAANVSVGVTTPVMTLVIPGNATDDVAANLLGGLGIAFDTAITVAATTGLADNDTGALGANEVVVNLFFK